MQGWRNFLITKLARGACPGSVREVSGKCPGSVREVPPCGWEGRVEGAQGQFGETTTLVGIGRSRLVSEVVTIFNHRRDVTSPPPLPTLVHPLVHRRADGPADVVVEGLGSPGRRPMPDKALSVVLDEEWVEAPRGFHIRRWSCPGHVCDMSPRFPVAGRGVLPFGFRVRDSERRATRRVRATPTF